MTEQEVGLKSRWPSHTEEEIAAVTKVLSIGKTNYGTGGEGKALEREFADYCDCNHAVAVANGTVALELALRAIDIADGDEVVVTSRTFVASASSVVLVGGSPVFADVDPESQNITANSILKVLTDRTKAIIAVHLGGWPCDMGEILELARSRGLYVIEDCAQAHGAKYKGKSVGSFGDLAAWSFCQDKIITSGGEGGMITTNDEALWKKVWSLKDHGKSLDKITRTGPNKGFQWLHDQIGTNGRMTEMQSAIARIQLRNLDEMVATRNRNAMTYKAALESGSRSELIRIPLPGNDVYHAYYRF